MAKTDKQMDKLTKDFGFNPKSFDPKKNPHKDYRGEKNGKRI